MLLGALSFYNNTPYCEIAEFVRYCREKGHAVTAPQFPEIPRKCQKSPVVPTFPLISSSPTRVGG